jgi:hypothetical protein
LTKSYVDRYICSREDLAAAVGCMQQPHAYRGEWQD